jgi:hypothetical protein
LGAAATGNRGLLAGLAFVESRRCERVIAKVPVEKTAENGYIRVSSF